MDSVIAQIVQGAWRYDAVLYARLRRQFHQITAGCDKCDERVPWDFWFHEPAVESFSDTSVDDLLANQPIEK